MHTVVARFHHTSREPAEIESDLATRGANGAHITGYTVALTLEADSREEAATVARRLLDGIGATRIKVTKHRGKKAATKQLD